MLEQKSSSVPRLKNNQQSKTISLLLKGSLVLIVLGGVSLTIPFGRQLISFWKKDPQLELKQQAAVLSLVSAPPQQRASQLEVIATSKQRSRSRSLARYLLGVDLLQQQQPAAALNYLAKLEKDYPLLAPQILLKQAQAYHQSQQISKVKEIYQQLQTDYPNSPVVADVLALLGNQTLAQQQLITQFPRHPRTHALIRQQLQQNPDQWELMLVLVKNSRAAGLNPLRDRLVLEYPAELTPEDWEAIASGYWRAKEYRKAADAYSLARLTPRNLYRAARGFHVNGNIDEAKRAYQRLMREFHDAQETGTALIYLANISGGVEALVYLDTAIAKFPAQAPRALLAKAVIYDALGKPEAAQQARQKLLQEYADSEITAEYRWQVAQKLAASGDLASAWQWAEPIMNHRFTAEFAPKATFWLGKWATKLGKKEAAQAAFHKVITDYPQSYYAWRSAVFLGWKVGDFTSLRQLQPQLHFSTHSVLPGSSAVLKELYALGQYEEAWLVLQSEIADPQALTVKEQFSEGLLLVKLGETRAGIQAIWTLTERDNPYELQEWESLRQTDAYWYGLFPFPYQQTILGYAKQQQINPLLVISVMRKESTFAPEIASHAGAVGLMQIVPQTAEWVAQQTQLKDYALTTPKDNVNIGTWYLAHNHERYDNNSLLAIASYNAGTGNVAGWLERYNSKDSDTFVEQIPFPETKDYVEGVFSNYWNYLRLYNPEIARLVSRYTETLKQSQ